MGTDTEHDVDTLRIHHDMREQHIHLAAMKAMWFAAREFDAAHKVSTLLPTDRVEGPEPQAKVRSHDGLCHAGED